MTNRFGEVFLDKLQSIDLKLHSSVLSGVCQDSYNT